MSGSDDGLPGVEMVLALLIGMGTMTLVCARLLLWVLSVAFVAVQS